jgi:hypothetical protein
MVVLVVLVSLVVMALDKSKVSEIPQHLVDVLAHPLRRLSCAHTY